MSAPNVLVVCYCLLIISPNLGALDDPTLDDLISAIERMVGFYSRTYREINLDGIYGLRVLEGQLKTLMDETSQGKHSHLPQSTVTRLAQLYSNTQTVCNASMPHLRDQDVTYFNLMLPLITKPLNIFKEYRLIDEKLRWGTNVHKSAGPFDERFSDQCMSELMGTDQLEVTQAAGDARAAGHGCQPSHKCLMSMFTRGHGEYQLTHQLIYTLLAEQMGCVSVLNDWLKTEGEPGGIHGIQREFCTNNLMEMRRQVAALGGVIIPIYQDLFMEQEFVCSTLGFMQFLHLDWLKQILSWQKPNGCLGAMPKSDLGRAYTPQDALDYEYLSDDADNAQRRPGADTQNHRPNVVHMQQMPQESLVIQQTNNTLHLHKLQYDAEKSHQPKQKPPDNPLPQTDYHNDVNQWNVFNEPINPGVQQDQMEGRMNLPNSDVRGSHYGEDRLRRKLLGFHPEPSGHRSYDRASWSSRRLLLEKGLADHCLSHKTAVAAGALSQYLRFMIHPGTDDYRRSVSISGYNLLLEPAPLAWSDRGEAGHVDKQAGDEVMVARETEDEKEAGDREVDEDYGADEDEDGYNEDTDDDDDEDYVVDDVHQSNISPRFQRDNHGVMINGETNDQDEEYEQYIEEDDDEGEQGAGDKAPLEPIRDLAAQPNDPFNLENHHRDEEDGYNYYDNEEEENRLIQTRLGHFDERRLEQVMPIPHERLAASGHKEAANVSNLESSLGRIYLFIFLTMIAFLLLLYRFIKRRKVVIRYYHR